MEKPPLPPSSSSSSSSFSSFSSSYYVVVACDATKDRSENEIKQVLDNIRKKGAFLSAGDRLLVFCVLHKVLHPSKCYTLLLVVYKYK